MAKLNLMKEYENDQRQQLKEAEIQERLNARTVDDCIAEGYWEKYLEAQERQKRIFARDRYYQRVFSHNR